MDIDTINIKCKLFSEMTGIPIGIFIDDLVHKIFPENSSNILQDLSIYNNLEYPLNITDETLSFMISIDNSCIKILVGPIYYKHPCKDQIPEFCHGQQTISMNDFFMHLDYLYKLLGKRGLNKKELFQVIMKFYRSDFKNNIEDAYDSTVSQFLFDRDIEILGCLESKETKNLEEIFFNLPLLSDSLEQNKFDLTMSCSLLTFFIIRAGVELEKAYSIRNQFIRKLNDTHTNVSLKNIYYEVIGSLMYLVEEASTPSDISPSIYTCICYIKNNLYEEITVNDIAEHAKISYSKLSRCFKQEVGLTISDYILYQKIIESQQLLQYTESSIKEISYLLHFSSQSHFQNVFKKQTGTTPNIFRKKNNKGKAFYMNKRFPYRNSEKL